MGSDVTRVLLHRLQLSFNPRSHMGSDSSRRCSIFPALVSIHAPTWGATDAMKLQAVGIEFQSTLPHGERPSRLLFGHHVSCFNPRSHMGSDIDNTFVSRNSAVSIHAPTWGATLHRYLVLIIMYVSIHAPTWGATAERGVSGKELMFQSTLPHGERLGIHLVPYPLIIVSIHAPTWGATTRILMAACSRTFQSTLPHGERQWRHHR